jgi:hypothetical protein
MSRGATMPPATSLRLVRAAAAPADERPGLSPFPLSGILVDSIGVFMTNPLEAEAKPLPKQN